MQFFRYSQTRTCHYIRAASYVHVHKDLHCKSILVTSTMFYLSQLHVCGVHIQGMLPNKSSEDLEIKTFRSFSFN